MRRSRNATIVCLNGDGFGILSLILLLSPLCNSIIIGIIFCLSDDRVRVLSLFPFCELRSTTSLKAIIAPPTTIPGRCIISCLNASCSLPVGCVGTTEGGLATTEGAIANCGDSEVMSGVDILGKTSDG